MAQKTLLELRNRAKEHADKVNSSFVSDSVWNGWINESAAELWDLIVSANEDYETQSLNFTITSGNTFALPADFYILRGLDKSQSGKFLPVRRFKFEERGFFQNTFTTTMFYPDVVYRVIKNNLVILPEDMAAGDYRLWYIPIFPELTTDGSVMDGRNSWDSFISLGAAIFALAKEESDTSAHQDLKDRVLKRLLSASSARDMGEPGGIVRTNRRDRCEDE